MFEQLWESYKRPWSVDVFNTASSEYTWTNESVTDVCCLSNQSLAVAVRVDPQRLFSASVGVSRKRISPAGIAWSIFSLNNDSERVKRHRALPMKICFLPHHIYATGWTATPLEKIRNSMYSRKVCPPMLQYNG
ncbi:hypothetical protein TNCV_2987001 [Trichonephila clavipes]|nr:hypothetical protein TNCV_2987001 [Trichonephila clavipes]